VKPAYFQNQNSGRDRWMVSYLDVLTIVLILFVAMAAQTLQNSQKKPASTPVLAAAPVKAPVTDGPSAALSAIERELEQSLGIPGERERDSGMKPNANPG
jgi:hypothetical protein